MSSSSAPPASPRKIAAIILAAGRGTRMKSDLHKVLHPVAGRPMLLHLLASVDALSPAAKVIIVGAQREQVEAAVAGTGALVAVQDPQLGTAHAVEQAHSALKDFDGDVLILYGDVPLVTTATLQAMLSHLDSQTGIVVLGFRPDDTAAYGRIAANPNGHITKMVEYKDASPAEVALKLCNSGLMAVRSADLWALLSRVDNQNAAQEYYLPDIVGIAIADGGRAVVIETDAEQVAGINSRAELAAVEAAWQTKRRQAMMAAGVTLIAPETVWFSYDTLIDADVTIEPHVFFGPGVDIARGVVVHGFSHISGSMIGQDAEVGPFVRLRPGTELGAKTKVGNFVEIKKSRLGVGAKASHLSYLGDADIGAGANIGAGTITCNYDGFFKYRTTIGVGAFIGSNSALVAPVQIGDGAMIAAGSVITTDVADDALGLGRAGQSSKKGWAGRFRAAMSAKKATGKKA